MSNHAGFLRKKKVLLSFLLPYGLFLIVANVIYRKVCLSRKGEGLTPICCFCCCCKFNFTFKINKIITFPESRLPLPLWGRWKPYPTPEFNKCHWWGSIWFRQRYTETGSLPHDIGALWRFLSWRSYDRSIGWSNSPRDNSTPRPVPIVYQILMVLFLHSYKRGYKKPNYT